MSHCFERAAHGGVERGLVVRKRAERNRLAARFGDRRRDDRAVGVVDRAGPQREPERRQFVAGRQHGDFRPPHDIGLIEPHAASMPISRDEIAAPRRSSVSPRAMSEPAYETNCPGATARRRSIAGAAASISSVCSIIATASAPRGIMPPVAIAVAVPGATVSFGAWPQASTSALSVRRRGAARWRRSYPRRAARSHPRCAVERRHVDRRRHVVRRARARAHRRAQQFRRQPRKIEMRLKPRLGVFGRHDFEELLLPRRRAHRIEQRDLGACAAGVVHGKARISSCAPAGNPSLSAGTNTQPSACAIACIGQWPDASGSTPSAAAAHRHDFAEADGGNDFSRQRHRHGWPGCGSAGQTSQEGIADHEKPRERRIEPAPAASAPDALSRYRAQALSPVASPKPWIATSPMRSQRRDARIAASRRRCRRW